jgi:hypothetical protein
LALGACGHIPTSADTNGDAGSDAPPAVGQVILHVASAAGDPVDGAKAVFTRPDGTFVSEIDADASGTITMEIIAGDVAHVGYEESGIKRLFTVAGLEPGDEIDLGRGKNNPSNPIMPQLTVTFAGAVAGAARYGINYGCTREDNLTSPTQTTIQLRGDCLAGGQYTALASAFDTADRLIAGAVLTDVNFPKSTAFGPWQAPAQATLAISNVPTQANQVRWNLQTFRKGIRFEDVGGVADSPLGDVDVNFIANYADAVQLTVQEQFGIATNVDGVVIVVQKDAPQNLGDRIDANFSTAMPRFFKASYDAVATKIDWQIEKFDDQQDTTLAQSDATLVQVFWGQASAANLWTIMEPGGQVGPLSYQLHGLSSFHPVDADPVLAVVVIGLSIDVLSGYGQFKNDLGSAALEGGLDELPKFRGSAAFTGFGPK